MSCASSRHRRRPSRGQAGTTSLEFALVAVPFFFLLIAATDLGRYFITQHSLRTLTSETARLAMVICVGSGTCAAGSPVAFSQTQTQTLWAKAPFLSQQSSWPAAGYGYAGGVSTITVTVQYPFAFVLPVWSVILPNETCGGGSAAQSCPGNTICETTCLTY